MIFFKCLLIVDMLHTSSLYEPQGQGYTFEIVTYQSGCASWTPPTLAPKVAQINNLHTQISFIIFFKISLSFRSRNAPNGLKKTPVNQLQDFFL